MALAAAFAVTGSAAADWPIGRHDVRRTGVAPGASDIAKPASYYRIRLGGSVGPNQVYVGDVDKDGKEDVLFVSGGALVLGEPDGTVRWATPARGFNVLVGVADLDGDGQLDILASSSSRGVFVIAAATGATEWELATSDIGSPGAFRIRDLDADGKPDLWVDTCGCCAVETGSPGVIFSFASGFAAPAVLGVPPARAHCGANSDTIADLDGDGQPELVQMADDSAQIFHADGGLVGQSGTLPQRAFRANCEAANLDGKPGEELVCFSNTVYNGGGERGVFALAYHPGEQPPLALLWNAEVSAADGGDARAPSNLVVDLDGDGQLEVVISGLSAGKYVTSILDAATGAPLATVDGVADGDVASAAPGQLLLVAQGDTLVGLAFSRKPAPALTKAWQLGATRALYAYDWSRAARTSRVLSVLGTDLDGDARRELVLASATEPSVLTAYDLGAGAPKAVATYAVEPGVGVAAAGVPTDAGGVSSLFVARNDGYVATLDKAFAATNLHVAGGVSVPGLYVGGYYTGAGAFPAFGLAPIAGRLSVGETFDSVLVVDSRGDLVAYDARGATNSTPAKLRFRLADTYGASLRPAAQQSASIGAFRRVHPLTDPPKYQMASFDGEGNALGALGLARPPAWDVLPAELDGNGVASFVGLSVDAALSTDVTAMTAKGAQRWQASLSATAGTMPFAVGDWNVDGVDDVVAAINVAHVYSGKDGKEIAAGADPISYFMPILANLSGGNELDMVLQGGYFPARALGPDMKPLWVAAGPAQPFPFGALATCASGPVLVEGSFSTSPALTLTQAAGPNAAQTSFVVLASGAAYASTKAAKDAGALLGQLGDVAVSADLDGTHAGPTALVGSTDGYLYAVDACTGAFRWAHAFGAPVGAPILADTDGDGKDEILVSVADGYLYALRHGAVASPAWAWDTDPPHGITGHDVDDVVTTDTLYATWAAAAGATSYEVTAVGIDGAHLTKPDWVDVGLVTEATLSGLALADGQRYVVSVRAVAAVGRSPDVPTNGVVVHFPGGTGGAGGAAGAGGAGTGGAGTGGAGTGGAGGGATTSHDAGAVGGAGGAGGVIGTAVPASAAPGENSSSCGCVTVGAPARGSAAALLLVLPLALALRQHRRRPSA